MKVSRVIRAVAIPGALGLVVMAAYMWGRTDERRGAPSWVPAVIAQQPQDALVSPTAPRDRDAYFPAAYGTDFKLRD